MQALFTRKGKDPEPDPYLWLMDPDPGGPKTCWSCGSGSPTLPIGTRRRNKIQKIKWTGQLTLVLLVALEVVVVFLFHVSSEVGGLGELVPAHSALKSKTMWPIRTFYRYWRDNTFWTSMTFYYGSGTSDPYPWLTDPAPAPALYVSDLLSFFAYYFLKVQNCIILPVRIRIQASGSRSRSVSVICFFTFRHEIDNFVKVKGNLGGGGGGK